MNTSKPTITYTYRGQIERGPDYHWMDGYSNTLQSGAILYPWMTKRECQRDARSLDRRAIFVRQDGAQA